MILKVKPMIHSTNSLPLEYHIKRHLNEDSYEAIDLGEALMDAIVSAHKYPNIKEASSFGTFHFVVTFEP